jgi:hypothetical protein
VGYGRRRYLAHVNALNWPEIVGAIGGAVGAVGGTASVIVAAWARRDAKASAQAAKESAEAARTLTQLEQDRQHERLSPPRLSEIRAIVRDNDRLGAGHSALMGSITLPCDYRVRADAISGNSKSEIWLPLPLSANQEYEFQIEQWSPGRTKPQTEMIRFRFWPPNAVDVKNPWTCRCGQPTEDGDGMGSGHWEWTAPVTCAPPNIRWME